MQLLIPHIKKVGTFDNMPDYSINVDNFERMVITEKWYNIKIPHDDITLCINGLMSVTFEEVKGKNKILSYINDEIITNNDTDISKITCLADLLQSCNLKMLLLKINETYLKIYDDVIKSGQLSRITEFKFSAKQVIIEACFTDFLCAKIPSLLRWKVYNEILVLRWFNSNLECFMGDMFAGETDKKMFLFNWCKINITGSDARFKGSIASIDETPSKALI